MNEEETDHLRRRPNVEKTERTNAEDIRLPQKSLAFVPCRWAAMLCITGFETGMREPTTALARTRTSSATLILQDAPDIAPLRGRKKTATSFRRCSTLFTESRMDT